MIDAKQTMIKKYILLLMMACCQLMADAENYPYRNDVLWVTLPDHADWLYKTGEKARVEVGFYRYGVPQNVEVSYEIGPDLMPASSKGKVVLKNGRATIDMGTMKKPGFRDLRLMATIKASRYEHHVKVGFSVNKIVPFTQEPKDFWAFWQENLIIQRVLQ
jgi:hypothetical protein